MFKGKTKVISRQMLFSFFQFHYIKYGQDELHSLILTLLLFYVYVCLFLVIPRILRESTVAEYLSLWDWEEDLVAFPLLVVELAIYGIGS